MGDNEPKRSSKRASFIKILDHDFAKQLEIPREFIVNFNGYRPNRFIIESSFTKHCLRVEVEEDKDGMLYIRDGWGDFVEAHSLEAGNILVFEYEEQSIFQVKIYGRNGCEKPAFVETEIQNPRKLRKTIVIEDNGEGELFECEEKKVTSRPRPKPRTLPLRYKPGINKKHHRVGKGKKRVSTIKRNQITSTNDGSLSENSVNCFSITLNKRKKHLIYQVTVPMAVSSLKKLSSKEKLELRDAKGKCWPVKIIHTTKGRSILGRGWRDFLDGNNIVSGDTLKFEFTSDDLVEVHVTRASKVEQHNEEASGSDLNIGCKDDETVTCKNDDKAMEDSNNKRRISESNSSSFTFIWRKSTIAGYLYVPKSVAKGQNLGFKDSVVIRDPQGKCWPLEVKKTIDGRVLLTKGWTEFWKGHDIKAGDSLQFKFVSEFLIQVTIKRGNAIDNTIEDTPMISNDENTSKGDNEGFAVELETLDVD